MEAVSPAPIRQRRERKPKVTDRLNSWALAYDSIRTITGEKVSPDGAAIAAAILSSGNIDLTDPSLQAAANLIGWGKGSDGHQPG